VDKRRLADFGRGSGYLDFCRVQVDCLAFLERGKPRLEFVAFNHAQGGSLILVGYSAWSDRGQQGSKGQQSRKTTLQAVSLSQYTATFAEGLPTSLLLPLIQNCGSICLEEYSSLLQVDSLQVGSFSLQSCMGSAPICTCKYEPARLTLPGGRDCSSAFMTSSVSS
jgi:hypothetical protein